MSSDWLKGVEAAITVCNRDGIIVYMNERSAQMFAEDGGYDLIGRNLLDCHPGTSRDKLEALLMSEEKNCYTIEKNGKRKLIYQVPWYDDGAYAGLAEFALPLPNEMPHFIRK